MYDLGFLGACLLCGSWSQQSKVLRGEGATARIPFFRELAVCSWAAGCHQASNTLEDVPSLHGQGDHGHCDAPGNAAAVVCPCTGMLPRSRRGWSAMARHSHCCPSDSSLENSLCENTGNPPQLLVQDCPSVGWDRVNFLASSWHSAVPRV